MGIQLTGLGQTAAIVADPTFDALRITSRPMENINWQVYSGVTGTIAAAAAAWTTAGVGAFFSLRNNGSNLIMVRKVTLGMRTIAGFTAGQMVDFALIGCRNFTSAPTGGTVLTTTNTTANTRLRSSMPAPSVNISISTTGLLTTPAAPNTKVFNANFLGYVNCYAATATVGQWLKPDTVMFEAPSGDFPIILRNCEGIELINVTLWGAGATWVAQVGCEYAEVPLSFAN